MVMVQVNQGMLEIGGASFALDARTPSGDQYLIAPFVHGTLVAVVDGLGHGDAAAQAASLAVETLKRSSDDTPAVLLFRCHEALHGLCGVSLSLALFDDRSGVLSWLGIGNVWGSLFRFGSQQYLLSCRFLLARAGLVGVQLPSLKHDAIVLRPKDTLVFATNGIHRRAGWEAPVVGTAQHTAEEILSRHKTGGDDAVVLVARFLGPGPRPARAS